LFSKAYFSNFKTTNKQNKVEMKTRLQILNTKAFLLLWFFLVTGFTFAQTNTWTGTTSNSWSVSTNWSLGVVPTSAHDVVIPSVATNPRYNAATATVNSITVQNGGILLFERATTLALTVTTNVTVNAGGTFSIRTAGATATSTMSIAGNFTNDGTVDFVDSGFVNITFNGTSSQTISGSGATMSLNAVTLTNAFPLVLNRTIDLNANWTNNGKTVSGTGTVTLSGTSIIGGTTTTAFPNLTVSGTASQGISTSVSGTFTQTAGTYTVTPGASAYTLTVLGAFTQNGGTFNVTGTTATAGATVTVTGATTINGSFAMEANSANSGSTVLFQANGDVLFGTAATFDWMAGGSGGVVYNVTFGIKGNFNWSRTTGQPTTSGSGTSKGFTFNGVGTTAAPQTLTYSGTSATYYGGIYAVNTGTVVRLLTNAPIGTTTVPYNTFTVNGTLDMGTFVISGGSATVNAINTGFTLANGATLITAKNTGVLGSVTTAIKNFNSGAKYEFNSAVANQSTGFTGLTITTPNSILISNSFGTVTADASVTFGSSATLTVNSGALFDANTRLFTFGATPVGLVLNGTFRTNNTSGFSGTAATSIVSTNAPTVTFGTSSTVEYYATAAQAVSARTDYRNLIFTGASTKTLGGAVTALGTVVINTGATLALNGFTFSTNGTSLTNNGTINGTVASSILRFGGSTAQTYTGTGVVTSPLQEFRNSNSNASGLTLNSSINPIVTLGLRIFNIGGITNANKLTIGDGTNTTVIQISQATNTGITVGNLDVAPTFNLGAAALTMYYLQEATSRTTGFELPTVPVAFLTIDNTNHVTLNKNLTVSTTLTLTNGKLLTAANTATIGASGTVVAGANWVVGNLAKQTANGASPSFTYPIGSDISNYTPIVLTFAGNNTSGSTGTITATTTSGDHAQITASGIDAGKTANRNWTLTNSGISGSTYDATFTFVSGDLDGGATTSNFVVRRYVNPTWFTTTTGTRTGTTTQATGLSTYGDFQIGEASTLTVATHPASGSVCGGSATTFTSTSTSIPTPTIQWQRGISGVYANIDGSLDGGVYANFNTPTLAISNTTGLNGYTYQAVFTNINGTATSTAATLSSGKTATYTGSWSPSAPSGTLDTVIISANYTTAGSGAGSFSACSLTVDTGAVVTVSSGDDITLNGAVTVLSGSLTFENNATLIQTNTAANTDAITVKRNSASLMRQDYTLWSSPVSGQQLQAFSPMTLSSRFYTYDSGSNIYVATSATGSFVTGTGYLIRMPNNHPVTPTVWSGQFTGVPNNGTVSLSVSSGTYNAVGNPYPSKIDADAFITDNSITEALYFWRKTNNAATNSYATYTLAGGAGTGSNSGDPLGLTPNGTIQVGQGFIAKATSSTLDFTNSMRVANSSNQFLRTNENRSRIWLDLSNADGALNQMMVAYMPTATAAVDAAIDGRFYGDALSTLTSTINDEAYTIQGRAPFDANDVVALGFKAEIAGNYTITLSQFDGLFEATTQAIYLKDNVTNTTHNLKAGAYTFASEAGAFANRFEIVYAAPLAVNQNTFDVNTVVVYKQNNQLVINTGKVAMANVDVYDISGRLVASKNNIKATETKINVGTTKQVLLVKITSIENGTVTKKVIH
jgi:hypothetical protein